MHVRYFSYSKMKTRKMPTRCQICHVLSQKAKLFFCGVNILENKPSMRKIENYEKPTYSMHILKKTNFCRRNQFIRTNFWREKKNSMNMDMLYMGFCVIFSWIHRRPSIFVILKNHSVRVKMVSKVLGINSIISRNIKYCANPKIPLNSEKICKKSMYNKPIFKHW